MLMLDFEEQTGIISLLLILGSYIKRGVHVSNGGCLKSINSVYN